MFLGAEWLRVLQLRGRRAAERAAGVSFGVGVPAVTVTAGGGAGCTSVGDLFANVRDV